MNIKFITSDKEQELIIAIANRAHSELFEPNEIKQSRMDTVMDITACISNGCPLRLQELLDSDIGNFGHDVAGIRRHINRRTGKL